VEVTLKVAMTASVSAVPSGGSMTTPWAVTTPPAGRSCGAAAVRAALPVGSTGGPVALPLWALGPLGVLLPEVRGAGMDGAAPCPAGVAGAGLLPEPGDWPWPNVTVCVAVCVVVGVRLCAACSAALAALGEAAGPVVAAPWACCEPRKLAAALAWLEALPAVAAEAPALLPLPCVASEEAAAALAPACEGALLAPA
jgi:hypothetical protein